LRALYEMVSGHPDRALPWFDRFSDARVGLTGYIALQRQNAAFLAGDYERYVNDVSRAAGHREEALSALDIARLAYIERIRGARASARRLVADLEHLDPADIPWTHRSLFTYQLVEMKLLDDDTEAAARLARTMLPRIGRMALSPTTGAFECCDAVARAFLAEANRLARLGHEARARALVREAERAVQHAPLLEPPLFVARLLHDRALVALALGRHDEGMQHLAAAEQQSRDSGIPCFRMRLLEDLLDVLDAGDPHRAQLFAEANALSAKHRLTPRQYRARWLFPLAV
jgi:hypothetical protein